MKKVSVILYFACIFIFGMLSPLGAQKEEGIEEMLQEFFMGETVYAQDAHEVQFTSKPVFWNKSGIRRTSIPFQFEYGLTDRFQVELNLPYHFLHSKTGGNIRGTGNMEVGFLYNILKGNRPFALSLAVDVGLPTANKEKNIDEEEVEWEPGIIIAKQVGRGQVHASLGAEITKSESAMYYKLGTVFPFGAWRATLELNGTISINRTIYLTPGFTWKGLDDFEFGLGFSKGMTGTMEWGTILMATYEFSLTKKN